MYRIKYSFTVLIFLGLFLQQLVPVAAQDEIPTTAVGKSLSALIASANDADEESRLAFLKDGFAKNDDQTVKRRKMQTDQLRSQLGQLTLKKVVNSSDNRISAVCETSNGPNIVLTVTITEESPYKIESVKVEMSGDGESVRDAPMDVESRSNVVERLAKELRAKYVYPEVGEQMAVSIEKADADGDYSDFENARDFASHLTDQLREICSDKHLRVRAGASRRPGKSPRRRPIDNHGFVKAEMLPGGIGYLKFNYFSGDKKAQKTASAAMNFLGHSDALIFDLRENGGGSPDMIAFLTSYLFDEPVHLNSFYNRPTETTTESWTQEEVPGKKFSPETPVFVLTSSNTFSGAEEFSYNLKNLKRGTIVGETTGGGAHPVMPVTLGKHMHITMPFARAINPITETNWEGVGVKPHVEVSADLALDMAIDLAKAKLVDLAANKTARTETTNVDVDKLMETAEQLMAEESFAKAVESFARITKLDPENELAWFRYGYCLHMNGELDKAIEIHKKAAGFSQFAGISTYNLACAYSLKNQVNDAIVALEKAVDLGFGDTSQLEGDSDLDNVREDDRYTELIKKINDKQ